MGGISVDRVGELWERWQRFNPSEAKTQNDKVANMFIFGNAKHATASHICFVANVLGIDKAIVAEYVLRNRDQ